MRAVVGLGKLGRALPLALVLLPFFVLLPAAGAAGDSPSAPATSVTQEHPADPLDIGPFPESPGQRPQVAFWTRVYLDVDTDSGFIHDARHLSLIYETATVGPVARQRKVNARKRHWRAVLDRLAAGKAPRDDSERFVVTSLEAALGREPKSKDFKEAKSRIRFQLGQRDNFRKSLIRSGAHRDRIRAVFKSMGLPEDLGYLPHVESSFNPRAYSKSGAAGMWQFMRATGRRYMTIDNVMDERLDPVYATQAAARLLRDNYKLLGTWPLALTAYNHGGAGMRRAVRALGTTDMATIVEHYKSRTFGFASRNFYAQFLAARKIVGNYQAHFGDLELAEPLPAESVVLPFYAEVKDIERYLGVPAGIVSAFNPSLLKPVFRSQRRIPRGFELRLPEGSLAKGADQWLAGMPADRRFSGQRPNPLYKVRRGDTLAKIAKARKTTVKAIVAMNGLRNRNRIYPGQKLRIPGDDPPPKASTRITAAVAASETKPAKREPVKRRQVTAASPQPAPTAVESPAASGSLPPVGEDSPWRRLDGDSVMVAANESLKHFAGWLEVPSSRLRELNGLKKRGSLAMGQRLKVDLSKVPADVLIQRRARYHKGMEEAFLNRHEITGTLEHVLRPGENLWVLAQKVYSLPAWLLHRYNPGAAIGLIRPGRRLKIPIVARLSSS